METISIKKEDALKAYQQAGKELKAILTTLFGTEVLDQKITDRVKTFKNACDIAGVSENLKQLLDYKGGDKDILATQAHAKVIIIAKALNEGWTPDFSNSNQVKYYPWFKFSPGVGFSFDDYVDVFTFSFVGSRLCFKSSELAKYAAEQFKDIYNDLFN
jgi:hypothetical protein